MPTLVIRNFSGVAPKIEPELLADTHAQTALNVNLERMSLRPLEDAGTLAVTLGKTGTIKSIYRFGQALTDETQHWFHWTAEVDVVRGPIPTDTTERTYFTGDGAPKYTDATLGPGAGNMPAASYTLGIPRPASAPNVAVTGAAGGGSPEYRVYVYTYVSNYNGYVQEGKPSAPSAAVSVEAGQGVDASAFLSFPAGYNLTGVRLYCAGSDGIFRQVAEQSGSVPATLSDTLTPEERAGQVLLDSENAAMPPSDLACLTALPNGVLAGCSAERSIRFCDPFKPYAWPDSYELLVDNNWVGLGAFGQSLVVLTKGYPEIISGIDPSSMAQQPLKDFNEACASRRSIASGAGGVMYASPNGLCRIGEGGFANLTAGLFTGEQWQALNPSSMRGFFQGGQYVCFYDTGTVKGGFIFNPADARSPFSFIDAWGSAGYVDRATEILYFVDESRALRKWRGSATLLPYTWRSKVWEADTDFRMGALEAHIGTTGSATISVYGDGTLLSSQVFAGGARIQQRRLPIKRIKRLEVEISGTASVTEVTIAPSIAGLRHGG